MKLNRHAKILELIRLYPINTQEELLNRLSQEGYQVTQSTVSRDIKSLRLQKALSPDGRCRYSAPATAQADIKGSFGAILSGSFCSVVAAQNLVVIKTFAGMASAVCAAIDAMSFSSIVGSLAGDDTIFIACTSSKTADEFVIQIKKYIS